MEDLRYVISADTSKFKAGMKEVKTTTESTNETLKTLGKTLVGVFSGIAVGAFIKSTVDAAVRQEKAVDQLAQAFKNQGLYTKEVIKQWEHYAASLQKVTTFGDEEIMQAQSLAVSFGLTGNKLKEVTKAAMDFSAANNVDLDTSMELLGRAFAGNTQSLTRYGIVIDTTKSKSQQFSEIIKQLNQRFGGQAEMLARTYGGQLKQFSNAWGDLKETIGFAVLPTLTKVTNALKDLFVELQNPRKALNDLKGWFNNLPIWSKLLLAFAGTFAVFKTVGLVWTLLSKIVVDGATMMGTAFKLLFSWPALIAIGAFILYTAWDHNWWGIKTITLAVWNAIYPVFINMWKWISKGWNWTINVIGKGWNWLTETAIPWVRKTFTTAWIWTINAAGTFVEELTTVRDFIDKTAVTVWNWVSNVSGKFWDWWSNTTIGKYINSAVSTAWSWIVNGIGSAWDWLIKDAPGMLKDAFTTFWKWSISGFEYFINNVVPWVQNTFSTTWAWTISGLTTIVNTLFVWLKPAFSSVWSWSIKGLSWFIETVSPWVKAAFSTSWNWSIQGVKWFMNNVVPWISSSFKTMWSWSVTGLKWFQDNIASRIVSAISTVWSWTVSGLTWFNSTIVPFVKDTFVTGWNWTVSGFDWFQKHIAPWLSIEKIPQAWSWTVSATGSFLDWLPKAKSWIGNALSTTWNWASSGLSAIIDSVKEYTSKPLSTAWSFISKNFDSIKKSIDAIDKYTGKPLETAWKFAISGLKQIGTVSQWFGTTIATVWNWTDKGLNDIIKNVNQYTVKPLETVWNWTVKGASFLKDLLSGPQTLKTTWQGISTWFNINVWNRISAGASTTIQDITKVWNGLVDVMKSAGQKVAAAFATPLNFAIKALNTAIKGMNLIPYVNIPLIPEIATAPQKKATGGLIVGPGGPMDDLIPALLSNGEYVVPEWIVKSYQPLIRTLETIRLRGYRYGGAVTSANTTLASYTQPHYLADMQDELNKMAEFLKSVLNPIFAKLGLNIDLTGANLDVLNQQLNKAVEQLNKANDVVNTTTDKFASLKQALANSSEMFTYNQKQGLQFSGVMKGLVTGNWMGALISFGAELLNGLSGLKNVSAVLNPFATIIKGIVSALAPLNAILKPFVAPLVALGKAIGSIILAFSTLLVVFKPFLNMFTSIANTIGWLFDQLTLGINTVLSWFGQGFLTQAQIKEMQKTPQERMEENDNTTSTTPSGNTYSAGSTQPIYNNFTIIFKDNEVLSDDSPAVSHLADLFIEYVKSHGGVTVFS